MKKGLHRIVIPTLSICLGAAIVGSISGTVAWYQYSTRVSTAYLGTTAGTAGNLKLRIQGSDDWVNSLTKDDIKNYLDNNTLGQNIIPITAGNMGEDAAIKTYNAAADPDNDPADMKPLFFKNPIRSYEERAKYTSSSWLKADNSMYVQIPLQVAFIEFDGVEKGNDDKEYLAKDVYLSDLLIQQDWQNTDKQKNDLSSAIRVHISSSFKEEVQGELVSKTNNKLISKNGGSILTEGYLDLDGDDRDDTYVDGDRAAQYGFGDSSTIAANTKKVIYGEGVQKAYSTDTAVKDGSYKNLAGQTVDEKVYPSVVESVGNSVVLNENDFVFDRDDVETSKRIGRTIGYSKEDANWEQEYLNITLTIWLEGWQILENVADNPDTPDVDESKSSTMWDASSFIGSMFDVGIQFAVQAE